MQNLLCMSLISVLDALFCLEPVFETDWHGFCKFYFRKEFVERKVG